MNNDISPLSHPLKCSMVVALHSVQAKDDSSWPLGSIKLHLVDLQSGMKLKFKIEYIVSSLNAILTSLFLTGGKLVKLN